jgi:folate-binding protein YgfZ
VSRPSTLLDFGDWAVVRVSGPDAREFLQGAGTQDIAALEVGAALPSLFLTAKGRPIALAWLAPEEEEGRGFLLLVEPGGAKALPEHLESIRVMEDVEIRSMGGPAVGGAGLFAVAGEGHVARAQGLAGVTSGARALRASPMSFVLRPNAGGPESGAAIGPFASAEAAEAWRIAEGLPRAGVDFGEDRLATELALENAISLTKGCYVGQEVVARTTHRGAVRRRRVGFRYAADAGALPRGTKLGVGGETAGVLTSSTLEPGTGRGLGMGYLTTEALANPAEVHAIHESLTTQLEVAPWPL